MTALLEIRAARRRSGERETLAGLDLDLVDGELVALLGPNGAGKSTLLRAVAGRVPLDGGSIRVGGEPPQSVAARRRIGLVPQAIALHQNLSVRANLEIFGRLAGVTGQALDVAVDDALAWTGLAARARDAVRSLSGGMQRRVNIAAGTLHSPDLLLLDEPAVGLDPVARSQVHEVLHQLRRRAMTMLLTTHDLHEAESLADRVAIMKAGRILRIGPPCELVREIFGTRKELVLQLGAGSEPQARQVLIEAGLKPTATPGTWIGAVTDDLHELDTLRLALRDAGLAIGNLLVRDAGLHGVFLHLTGQEIDP